VIQRLLKENGATGFDEATVRVSASGAEASPSEVVQSPETYVGYARAANFASPERLARDARKSYRVPTNLALNQWAFGGSWYADAEKCILQSAPGRILFRLHSRDFHMVLGPAQNAAPVRFKMRLNGVEPGDDHGSDCGVDGTGEVRQPRMFQLVRQKGLIKDVTVEMEFLDPGIEAFSFTFG